MHSTDHKPILLGIETSTPRPLVLVAEQGGRCWHLRGDGSAQHGRDLVPLIERVLNDACLTASCLDGVAVALGPGSFTGLRVGLTVAKVMAFARNGFLIGLDSTAIIARACPAGFSRLDVVIDAQRGELSVSSFEIAVPTGWIPRGPARLVAGSVWLEELGPDVLVAGPALTRWRDRLPAGQPTGPIEPDPQAVQELAWAAVQRGEWLDLDAAEPHYFRPATAEERRLERAGGTAGIEPA